MKNLLKYSFWSLALGFVSFGLLSCGGDDEEGEPGFNIFSIEEDKTLGAQVAAEIDADTENFPLLDSATYPEAYGHIYRVRDSLLKSGKVRHANDFQWRVRIVKNDSVLNAFCTPGGYIYFYTGIIKFLDSEDQFAGVMGHEMAHAAQRHSTEALTKAYGIEVLFNIVLGRDNQGTAANIAKNLINLSYSRGNETDADMRAVEYLYATTYDARGVARFFEKMIDLGAGGGPEFLSTHPNPENRVQSIMDKWTSLGAKTGSTYNERYQQFKASLP